ncbi:ABC transporter permease [Leptothrix ochracea]|uniref:ABC transporter permease n=2 Tax=Leptothrix ochracea TaxID=735331 RepID=UPI0034E201F4
MKSHPSIGFWPLVWAQLWARPGVSLLNLTLLSLGLAAVAFVTLVIRQIEDGLQRDVQGIDLVVGAKGSPLQLMLAGVYHLDVPTGNIPLSALAAMRAQPLVREVIPMSLGDSVQGFRIVGTEAAYVAHYGAEVAPGQGRLWQKPLEAVLGVDVARQTGLGVGQHFAGAHGLGAGGTEHEDAPYTVVGLLPRTGTVLDRLVLTGLESVWAVHEAHHHRDEAADHDEREVTLLLLTYRSPLAAVSLPRYIQTQTPWQAASPAVELMRLGRLIGVGTEVMRGFSLALLAVAALSVLVGLIHAVRERLPDLAMLRMLGASPRRVAALVLAEAQLLVGMGLVLGLALAQGLTALLGFWLAQSRSLSVMAGVWPPELLWLIPGAGLVALIAAALPARTAYRLDVTVLLQTPR